MTNNIRIERAKRRITQKELAKEVGTYPGHLNLIENNKIDPRLTLAMKIARFFGIGTQELFNE